MVAKEYAQAIYELAIENNKLELYSEFFQVVLDSIKNQDFFKILTSPSIDDDKKKDVVSKVFHSLDDDFINFLKVIIDHKRFECFSDIYQEYVNLANNALGVVDVLVISAEKLNKSQNDQIEKALEERYSGKRINIKNMIDESLITGVKVICNGEALDISLKNSLDKLKNSLF